MVPIWQPTAAVKIDIPMLHFTQNQADGGRQIGCHFGRREMDSEFRYFNFLPSTATVFTTVQEIMQNNLFHRFIRFVVNNPTTPCQHIVKRVCFCHTHKCFSFIGPLVCFSCSVQQVSSICCLFPCECSTKWTQKGVWNSFYEPVLQLWGFITALWERRKPSKEIMLGILSRYRRRQQWPWHCVSWPQCCWRRRCSFQNPRAALRRWWDCGHLFFLRCLQH